MPFNEEPIIEFICSNKRKPFKLKNNIKYISSKGKEIIRVVKGFEFDGATIPKVLAPLAGCRHDEKYLKAALIHDKLCVSRELEWKRTHELFKEVLIETGVNKFKANLLYTAILLGGPKWS